MVGIKTLAYYIIPLVFLIIVGMYFFAGNDGAFVKLKKITSGIIKGADDLVDVGVEQNQASRPTLPSEHQEAVLKLKETIEKMKNSPKNNCFMNYKLGAGLVDGNGLPELGEKGTSLHFEKTATGMRMIVNGGTNGMQEVSRAEFAGVSPCVISGGEEVQKAARQGKVSAETFKQSVPQNFMARILGAKEGVDGLYYLMVNSLDIKYDTDGPNENKIQYNNGPLLLFKDSGFLYKPFETNTICFFPTHNPHTEICTGYEDGLSDYCLITEGRGGPARSDSADSIPYQLTSGRLQWCSLG